MIPPPRALLRSGVLPLALLLGPIGLPAQEEPAGGEKPKLVFRLLAVGDAPPFRQEIRNGVRYELDPPAGSIPPRRLQIPAPDGESEPVRVALGKVSEPIFVPAGPVSLFAVDDQGVREEERWHALQIPAAEASLALLWRDPGEKQWTKARSIVLADDLRAFPPGAVRFVNLTGRNAAIKLGDRELGLKPGGTTVLGTGGAPVRQVSLEIKVADGKGGWVPVANTALNQAGSERSNIIVYPADGIRPRNPVKMAIVRERAVLPKPPAKPEP